MIQRWKWMAAVAAAQIIGLACPGGTVIHVDDDAPPGGDGLSWQTAYRFLQDALAGAVPPAEIRVAQGTYLADRTEADPTGTGDREATFQLAGGVALKGGYAGQGAADPDERDAQGYLTTLSGDLAGNDAELDENACCLVHDEPGCTDPLAPGLDEVICISRPQCCEAGWGIECVAAAHEFHSICGALEDNSYHVVTGLAVNSTASIDGFTVTAGAGDSGGGLRIDGGSPTVSNCVFTANLGESGGGLSTSGGNPTITGCTFAGNTAIAQYGAGAGMYVVGAATITGCTFSSNYSLSGAGACVLEGDPVFDGCTFSGNAAWNRGGGMAIYDGAALVLECTFRENSVEFYAGNGGGLYLGRSDATVSACTFSGNRTRYIGGGLFAGGGPGEPGGAPIISTCVFTGNNATGPMSVGAPGGAGAALWTSAAVVIDCIFEGNVADDGEGLGVGGGLAVGGGASRSPTILGCQFTRNQAIGLGGGLYAGGDALIVGSTLVQNIAGAGGAGLHVPGSASPRVCGCTFRDNASAGDGGGARINVNGDSHLINCVFAGNTAAGTGGAIRFYNFSIGEGDGALINCTFAGNSAASGGGLYGDLIGTADQVTAANCILWGNTPDQVAGPDPPKVIYCDVEGGFPGQGNIDADPMFVDPASADLRLGAGSPCIDAGQNRSMVCDSADADDDGDTVELVPLDFDGQARFADDPATSDSGCGVASLIDIGAFEYQGTPSPVRVINSDLDADGQVTVLDLLIMLAAWGPCEACCPADVGAIVSQNPCRVVVPPNGVVDFYDVYTLLESWGL